MKNLFSHEKDSSSLNNKIKKNKTENNKITKILLHSQKNQQMESEDNFLLKTNKDTLKEDFYDKISCIQSNLKYLNSKPNITKENEKIKNIIEKNKPTFNSQIKKQNKKNNNILTKSKRNSMLSVKHFKDLDIRQSNEFHKEYLDSSPQNNTPNGRSPLQARRKNTKVKIRPIFSHFLKKEEKFKKSNSLGSNNNFRIKPINNIIKKHKIKNISNHFESDFTDKRNNSTTKIERKKNPSPKKQLHSLKKSKSKNSPKNYEKKQEYKFHYKRNNSSKSVINSNKRKSDEIYHFSINFNIAHPISRNHNSTRSLVSNYKKDLVIIHPNIKMKKFKECNINNSKGYKSNNSSYKNNLSISSSNKSKDSRKGINSKRFTIKKPNDILLGEKYDKNNLLTILKNNIESKKTEKIMDILALGQVNKKLKNTLIQIDANKIQKEIKELETNEICDAIEKLPIRNPNYSIDKSQDLFNNNIEGDKLENRKNYNSNDKNNNKDNNYYTSKTLKIDKNERKRFLIRKQIIYDSLNDEENEDIEMYFFYIDPNSSIANVLNSIFLISSIILCFYLPIFLAKNLKFCRNIFGLDQLFFHSIDLLYIIDLITEFFKAYYDFDDVLIKNIKMISKRYIKSWFLIDLIQAIPFYTILTTSENKCELINTNIPKHYNLETHKIYYIFIIIKILKISKVIYKNEIFKRIKSRLNDFDFFFEYKTLMFYLICVISSINVSSCLFIYIGRNSYPGWIVQCNLQNESFIHIYLIAIYYLMTSVTTVGYGDIIISSINERIFQIVILIVGTCAYSWIITYISNYIKKINEKYIDYEKKLSILEEMKLSNPHFTINLYDKIYRYLQYNRKKQQAKNEIIINCLPYPLKNTLFMEMYKKIINNFGFFKYFENTNFIVKIVTSFKSVCSVKGDIIMEEGDFVEDIIFVKNGIISLEISIDLNCFEEYADGYLKESGFKQELVKKNSGFWGGINSKTFSINDTIIKNSALNDEFDSAHSINKNEQNKRYLKVIDIRKNEYFGDVLLFLNERAPLRARVKSKKAELFLLNKTEAIEISTTYPHIWKRILKKSLHNMQQLKKLAKKTVGIFLQMKGIKKKDSFNFNKLEDKNMSPQKFSSKSSNINYSNCNEHKNIEEIINISEKKEKSKENIITSKSCKKNESTNSFHNNENGRASTNKKNKKHKKKQKVVQKVNSLHENTKISKKSKNRDKLIEVNEKLLSNLNKKYTNIFPKIEQKENISLSPINKKELNELEDEYSCSNYLKNSSKSKSSNKNNNNQIYKSKYEENIKNDKERVINDFGKQNTKTMNNNTNRNENFIKTSSIFIMEQINDEIYPYERISKYEFLQNDSSIGMEKENIKNIDKNINKDEEIYNSNKRQSSKIEIIFSDDESNFKRIRNENNNDLQIKEGNSILNSSNSNHKKNMNFVNEKLKLEYKKCFFNLSISNTISNTIKSSYFNINQISNFKFIRDFNLQNETKKFLIEENEKKNKEIYLTSHSIYRLNRGSSRNDLKSLSMFKDRKTNDNLQQIKNDKITINLINSECESSSKIVYDNVNFTPSINNTDMKKYKKRIVHYKSFNPCKTKKKMLNIMAFWIFHMTRKKIIILKDVLIFIPRIQNYLIK